MLDLLLIQNYSNVVPILDYASCILGRHKAKLIDSIQNMVCRFYLGLHRNAPILAFTGDIGWEVGKMRIWYIKTVE